MSTRINHLSIIFTFAFVTLWLAAAPAVNAQPGTARFNNDDFGPSPDAFDAAPRTGNFSYGRTSTRDDRSSNSFGSRDPAWKRPSAPVADERGIIPVARTEQRRRPILLDELLNSQDPSPASIRLTPTQPVQPQRPVLPVTPTVPKNAGAKPQPTVAEKVAKRYSDPRVIRIAQQLNASTGLSLYQEIADTIDQRHVQPTSYTQRTQAGIEHLTIALETPAFQQASGMRSSNGVRTTQQQLRLMMNNAPVRNRADALSVIQQAQQLVTQQTDAQPGAVALEFVYGALDTLDQYSMFIAPERTGDASLGLKEQMVGIGVELEAHPQGLKILKALAGGPAAEATLRRGDIITAVDGQPVAGLELSQAVDLISGASGTPIQLELRRDAMIGDVTLVRRPFKIQSVSVVRMEANNVGYIKLDTFAESSTREFDEALWKLHNEGMQSLVIDLRGNPGGLLTTAIELSDRFLPGGTIVSTKGRNAIDNSEERATYSQTWKTPLVVLIDKNSASASEIFAAAVQENGRGLIVGETSYGKGTVQTLFPLRTIPSALRLTTAKFYSPDGVAMAGRGVTPDLAIRSTSGEGTQDAVLQAGLKAAIDPKLGDMAEKSRIRDRAAMRVMTIAG